MDIIKQLQELLKNEKNICDIIFKNKTIRVELLYNNKEERERIAQIILSSKQDAKPAKKKTEVLNVDGYKVVVKPIKKAKKNEIYYGMLEYLDLSQFDLSLFEDVCHHFSQGRLAYNIKEVSDIQCVSKINKVLSCPMGLVVGNHFFENVIGCIPVTKGEPKADAVLVCLKDDKLIPGAYISYKLGHKPSDFQNLSGFSEKSSPYIFNHKETQNFFDMLKQDDKPKEPFVLVQDKTLICHAVWGMDYGKVFGVNNCHLLAQGDVQIKDGILSFTHEIENGCMAFLDAPETQVVYGARKATGRASRSPCGARIEGLRVGLFFRCYRQNWLLTN